jgi:hypothetical protein
VLRFHPTTLCQPWGENDNGPRRSARSASLFGSDRSVDGEGGDADRRSRTVVRPLVRAVLRRLDCGRGLNRGRRRDNDQGRCRRRQVGQASERQAGRVAGAYPDGVALPGDLEPAGAIARQRRRARRRPRSSARLATALVGGTGAVGPWSTAATVGTAAGLGTAGAVCRASAAQANDENLLIVHDDSRS